MDLGLRNRKALITGGTKGIGRAIADTLAAEGCHVAICSRHADEVAAAPAAIGKTGARATGRALDVADGPALSGWIEASARELGGLDILVANVSALAIPNKDESWRKEFEIDM